MRRSSDLQIFLSDFLLHGFFSETEKKRLPDFSSVRTLGFGQTFFMARLPRVVKNEILRLILNIHYFEYLNLVYSPIFFIITRLRRSPVIGSLKSMNSATVTPV